jgi:hypothetical protein
MSAAAAGVTGSIHLRMELITPVQWGGGCCSLGGRSIERIRILCADGTSKDVKFPQTGDDRPEGPVFLDFKTYLCKGTEVPVYGVKAVYKKTISIATEQLRTLVVALVVLRNTGVIVREDREVRCAPPSELRAGETYYLRIISNKEGSAFEAGLGFLTTVRAVEGGLRPCLARGPRREGRVVTWAEETVDSEKTRIVDSEKTRIAERRRSLGAPTDRPVVLTDRPAAPKGCPEDGAAPLA